MKLRAITLENVRQFAGKVLHVSDMQDGLNVIAEPNEFGKSTLFDALQAVFFQPFGSANAEVKSLQPQPGEGAVAIAVEIAVEARHYRIEKRFLSRKQARITDLANGAILAQDGAAEAWIDQLLGNGGIRGPAGLLWVRQGGGDFDWSAKPRDDTDLPARRDILSAVAGEIDLVTGGRRFDLVMQQTDAALAVLQSARSGRPTGAWSETIKSIDTREAAIADLRSQVADLSDALAERHKAEARLTVLEAPAPALARQQALEQTRQAMQAAQDHARQLDEARTKAALADAHLREAALPLERLVAAIRQAETAGADLDRSATDHADAVAFRQDCQQRLGLDKQAQAAALERRDALRRQDTAAREQASREQARAQAAALADRLEQANAARRAQEAAQAEAGSILATPAHLAAAEQADAACTQAARDLAATGMMIQVEYLGQGRLTLDGQQLPPGAARLRGGSVVELPGVVRLTLQTGDADSAAATVALDRARAALTAALRKMEVPDLPTARAALRRQQAALAVATTQGAVLRALAPQGLDALGAELLRLQIRTGPLPEEGRALDEGMRLEPVSPQLIEAAEATLRSAEAALSACRSSHETALGQQVAAQTREQLARHALTLADEARGDPTDLPEREAALREKLSSAQQAAARAGDTAAALQAAAPDMATVKAGLDRAESILRTATADIARCREARAGLNEKIAARAEAGVEEALAEAEGELARLRERAAAMAAEAGALNALRAALTQARGAARGTYFGPVQDELRPLLAILHGDAALEFDPDRMLPRSLTRAGGTALPQTMQILSGGTREQIAILTRLAFARLLARQGRPVPVILDDALVHSDDQRIVAMFTALHRVAAQQQIVVLSCRQLAFDALGGHRPTITITPAG